jgi:FtsP/CotA-like multicopper oxidase with cupredoxin domain
MKIDKIKSVASVLSAVMFAVMPAITLAHGGEESIEADMVMNGMMSEHMTAGHLGVMSLVFIGIVSLVSLAFWYIKKNQETFSKNLKVLIGASILALLVITGIWYSHSKTPGYGVGMTGMNNMMQQSASEESDLTKLPDYKVETVRPTEIIELKDGDTYDMEATIVKQEVGNRIVKRLAYNGQIPGPVLKVQKDAKVTINFTNNIDMDTALHSHGLRGDWKMDGAVPITPPVKIGETFSYELEFPDTGVFWYHPHVREDYQQELGLYGNFIVEEDGYWNDVDQEAYLIVDYILEDGDFTEGVVTKTLMGRFGDTLLINDSENYNLTVKQGEITRVFVTNVANTRTFDLEFEGALTKLVGGDIGRIENEVIIDSQIIGTAERYIFELYYEVPGIYPIVHRGETMGTVTVEASEADSKADFTTLRSNAGDYSDYRSNIATLMAQKSDKNLRLDIEMKGMMGERMGNIMNDPGGEESQEFHSADDERMREHCQMMPEMAGCEEYVDETETTKRQGGGMMQGMMGGGMMDGEAEHNEDGIEWEDDMAMMNNMSNDEMIEWVIEDTDTGDRNDEIDWSFKQGDLVKISIYNDEKGQHPMQHPIHFHGQRFIVLSEDGEVNDNLQWKDTVLIPTGRTMDILVDMSNAGKWMAHCHIAEHLHSGMMFQFEVN